MSRMISTYQVKLVCLYARQDETYWQELSKHLSPWQQMGLELWGVGEIAAGTERAVIVAQSLQKADVIVLLISPDFLASDICTQVEMRIAMEQHKKQASQVLPVLVRPA